jgi:hypothetical protein
VPNDGCLNFVRYPVSLYLYCRRSHR